MAVSILENIKHNFDPENVENNSELTLEIEKTPEVIDVKENSEFDIKIFCPILTPHNLGSIKDSVNSGFSIDSSLDLKPCTPKPLLLPLYKENLLGEFETEDEKRAARHNLGLYDTEDIVAMSLLTTNNPIKDRSIFDTLSIKVMELGKIPFAVQTTALAVMVKRNNDYIPLLEVLGEYDIKVEKANSRIDQLLVNSSEGANIKTVGDITKFLQGFKNNESLTEILDDYLKFESKGEIIQQKWQI